MGKVCARKVADRADSESPKDVALTQCYSALRRYWQTILQLLEEKAAANAASNLDDFVWAQWRLCKALGDLAFKTPSKTLAAVRTEYYRINTPPMNEKRPIKKRGYLEEQIKYFRDTGASLAPDPDRSKALKLCYHRLAKMFQVCYHRLAKMFQGRIDQHLRQIAARRTSSTAGSK